MSDQTGTIAALHTIIADQVDRDVPALSPAERSVVIVQAIVAMLDRGAFVIDGGTIAVPEKPPAKLSAKLLQRELESARREIERLQGSISAAAEKIGTHVAAAHRRGCEAYLGAFRADTLGSEG